MYRILCLFCHVKPQLVSIVSTHFKLKSDFWTKSGSFNLNAIQADILKALSRRDAYANDKVACVTFFQPKVNINHVYYCKA